MRLMWTPRDPRAKPGAQKCTDSPGTPGKMPSRRRSCPGTRRPASYDSQRSSAPSLGAGGGRVPRFQQWVRRSCGGLSAEVCSSRFRRVWTGWLRGRCQLRSGLHLCGRRRTGGISRGHRSGGGREERRRGGHLASPRRVAGSSTGSERACNSQVPAGAGGSGIPGLLGRGRRPRPVPCPGGPRCPGSAGGRVLARPGTAAPRQGGGRRGAGPGRAGACSPAGPPRAARPPAKPGPPQRRVYPGITC